nr:MAG TPA: hypothetical protein [Caudoviricetes sp.]DAZ81589.1 MAG TPA: hypothetical protein [Caudoviricetes sp.]
MKEDKKALSLMWWCFFLAPWSVGTSRFDPCTRLCDVRCRLHS